MNNVVYTSEQQRRVLGVVPDLIRARELLLDLAWKDLRVRYRYALMGFVWAVLEPLAMMLILTFVFTMVFSAKASALQGGDERPVATIILSDSCRGSFLRRALTAGTRSLIDHQNLINKVFFPREVVPLASVATCLVNLVIGFVVLLAVHLILGGTVGVAALWFPVIFAIQLVMVIGLVLLLSCLNVRFRDVGYIVGVGIVFGFYASPVFYEMKLVEPLAKNHPWLMTVYKLNPMAELIPAYRQILFDNQFPETDLLVWPCVAALVCLVVGVVVFRRQSPLLSDYL